nr:hypothetical protein [Angustibacter aerolatus]
MHLTTRILAAAEEGQATGWGSKAPIIPHPGEPDLRHHRDRDPLLRGEVEGRPAPRGHVRRAHCCHRGADRAG